jgi:hypothetical protein
MRTDAPRARLVEIAYEMKSHASAMRSFSAIAARMFIGSGGFVCTLSPGHRPVSTASLYDDSRIEFQL